MAGDCRDQPAALDGWTGIDALTRLSSSCVGHDVGRVIGGGLVEVNMGYALCFFMLAFLCFYNLIS
jgi:hypothetical protein